MKIDTVRQACCAQDDQIGPLDKSFEVDEACSLGDLLQAVVASRFLQFSSTHTELSCRIEGEEVARVFSPYLGFPRQTLFSVPPDTPVREIAKRREIAFVFQR